MKLLNSLSHCPCVARKLNRSVSWFCVDCCSGSTPSSEKRPDDRGLVSKSPTKAGPTSPALVSGGLPNTMFSRGSSIVLSSNGSWLLCSRELSVSPINGSRHLRIARLLGVTSAGRCYSLRDTHMQRLTPLSTLCCRRPVDALCRSCTILSGSKPGHLHTSSNISISVRCCHQVSLRITSKFSYFDPALTASGNM